VNTILSEALFDDSKFDVYDLRTFFRPYKASAQSIGVIYSLKDPSLAKNITNSVLSVVNRDLEKTYTPASEDTKFEIKSTNPLVSLQKTKKLLMFIIVLVIGFMFSILVALLKNYLTSNADTDRMFPRSGKE
jgi:capsular polysaccharide biosynthesis protein